MEKILHLKDDIHKRTKKRAVIVEHLHARKNQTEKPCEQRNACGNMYKIGENH